MHINVTYLGQGQCQSQGQVKGQSPLRVGERTFHLNQLNSLPNLGFRSSTLTTVIKCTKKGKTLRKLLNHQKAKYSRLFLQRHFENKQLQWRIIFSQPINARDRALLSHSFYQVREPVHKALSEALSLCDSQCI